MNALNEKNEIILFDNDNIKLEVNLEEDTVWLTVEQMSQLFETTKRNVEMHIKNIYLEKEVEESLTSKNFFQVQKEGNREVKRSKKIFNLDVIISVGYRVKSKNGIVFRKWANKILKDYMLKGYVINKKRLEYLEKTIKIIDIADRMDKTLEDSDAKSILHVITKYTKTFNLLDDYDRKKMKKVKSDNHSFKINYYECIKLINKLKHNEKSNLFALERNHGLKSIINDIYQTFDGKDVYNSTFEKAANFLYMIVKNHVFIDGNKRIAAALFIYFLQFYNILYIDGKQIIDNNTLTSLTLLIAESNPKEKSIIIDLIMNFLDN